MGLAEGCKERGKGIKLVGEPMLLTSDESCFTTGTQKSGVCNRGDAAERVEKTPETHCEPTPGARGTYVLTHVTVGAAVRQP